jgi:IPT/TIG domain/FG-GAP-like repeat
VKTSVLPFFLVLLTFCYTTANAQVPTITSFSPTSGPAGTVVTITGTNFGGTTAENAVYFGGVKAVINTASATSLTVVAPTGAPPDLITVTAGGLTAYSTRSFYNTFNGEELKATSFALVGNLTVTGYPQDMTAADFDGDGKPDLASPNNNEEGVSILRNISTGPGDISFADKIDLVSERGPYSAKAVDIDGDGKLDIAVSYLAPMIAYKVSLYRNTSTPGNISFEPKIDMSLGAVTFTICANDLDGDGKPDLVILTNQVVSVYRNVSVVGTIGFDARQDFASGERPWEIAVQDLDQDSKPDLAVSNNGSSLNTERISIYRNTSVPGTITLTASSYITSSTSTANRVGMFVGDLDMDGKPDFAMQKSFGHEFYRNASTPGSFSFPSSTALFNQNAANKTIAINVDGDINPEFIQRQAGNSAVYRNLSTTGQIAIADGRNFPDTYMMTVSDFDMDNKPDLVMKKADGTVFLLRNQVNEPIITSFTPAIAGPGATITITGESLSDVTGVLFGGTAAASFTVVSPTSITAVVAGGASGKVGVTSPRGTNTKAGFTFSNSPPTVTSFSPTTGSIGQTITITGTQLSSATGVTFGGTNASSFTVVSDTEIKAVAAAGSSGDVVVVTSLGNATLSGFTFQSAPTITSFTPTSAAAGDIVTIKGTGFHQMVSVAFGVDGTTIAPFTVVDYNTITATVLSSHKSGKAIVVTQNGFAQLDGFVFLSSNTSPQPTISSFSPTKATQGMQVTITGTNFNGTTSVTFGGISTPFVVNSATSITATIGNGASGSVVVNTPEGVATAAGFTYGADPTITSFTPTIATKGTEVTITGTNFTGTTSLTFGGTEAKSFEIKSATSIIAIVGDGTAGSIAVTTPLGVATATGFNYSPPLSLVPTVSFFTPATASTGTQVTIIGTNFTGATAVTFGGTAAKSFSINSATTIVAVVGEGTTGEVSVTTQEGIGKASGFIYVPPVGLEDLNNTKGVAIFPMPSDGKSLNIDFESRWEGQTASLALHDLTGKLIASNQVACRRTINWNYGGDGAIGTGMYVMVVKVGGESIVRKVLVK